MAQKTVPDENDILYDTYSLDLVGFIQQIVEGILSFLSGGTGMSNIFDTLSTWWSAFSLVALLLSALFIAGFIYARIRIGQLLEIASARLLEEEKAWAHAYGGEAPKNNRWNDVLNHVKSDNPSDWRLGVIEADILLEEGLDAKGYQGASVGDRLKIVPNSIMSVQDAWDAHLIRNRIAHTGSDFILTKRMANEAIIKYERFLREIGAL